MTHVQEGDLEPRDGDDHDDEDEEEGEEDEYDIDEDEDEAGSEDESEDDDDDDVEEGEGGVKVRRTTMMLNDFYSVSPIPLRSLQDTQCSKLVYH